MTIYATNQVLRSLIDATHTSIMKSTEGHGLTDSAAVAEHEFMHHAEEDAGHGITDKVATAEYEFMHRVEQEEHEHEAELKRGLSNEAAEWEFDLIHGAEVCRRRRLSG